MLKIHLKIKTKIYNFFALLDKFFKRNTMNCFIILKHCPRDLILPYFL
jgi:hypothetical protein